MPRRRRDDTPYQHEYLTYLFQRGYEPKLSQILITDVPDRPAHYVRILELLKDGRQVFRTTGLSVQRVLHEAVDFVKHGLTP